MKFSDTLIGELQTILQEEYGVELSTADASVIGSDLVKYIEHLDRMQTKKSDIQP